MAGGLRFLRSELPAYVAAMHPDTQDDWSDTGIKGTLSGLAGEKL